MKSPCSPRSSIQALAATVMVGLSVAPATLRAESWPMRQRDAVNTGRAEFDVPANRQNGTFFDTIRWQKPSPDSPYDGRFSSGTMAFFDGAGPNGSDIVVGGYHWPKGVQGMDRHTGKRFWYGNTDGGESIGENTPAFSANGATIYVINDATGPEHPLMAFATVTGPSVYRHNGSDPAPWKLSAFSPKVGPDGRIYVHEWNDRPNAATDNGTSLTLAWSAQTGAGACYNTPQIWQDTGRLIVISGGRYGWLKAWHGQTGAELWSVALPQGADADATVDPANGRVYLPLGYENIWVAGVDKNGLPLWDSAAKPVFVRQDGATDPQRVQSAGCLSHDGLTYYFQTVSPNGQGKLYAINTTDGSVKWSYATGSRGWERTMSSPIVTRDGIIVVGNNEGSTYFALRDDGPAAILLDSLTVADAGEARNSATVSADGLLYLSGRWPWIAANGDDDTPSQQAENLFTAFDLNAGAFGPVAPSFTTQPSGQSIASGTAATLVAAASGSLPIIYQWYLGTAGDTSQPIAGATTASYTTPPLTSNASYWLRATNTQGSADSSTAVIQVAPNPVTQIDIAAALAGGAATVTSSSFDIGSTASLFDGNTDTLARTAAVNPMVVTLQFQQPLQLACARVYLGYGWYGWRIETADTLADLNGVTGSYRKVLDHGYDASDQWNEGMIPPGPGCRFVRLTLQRKTGDNYVHIYEWQLFTGTAAAPAITTQPQSLMLMAGQTLSADMVRVISTGTEPLTYEWAKFGPKGFHSGTPSSPLFPSQAQLDLGSADVGDEGIYRVDVSNGLGQVQSQEVVVGVNGIAQAQQGPVPDGLELRMQLAPTGIGGGWRFEGESLWRTSGEPATGLSAGKRTVVFKPVGGLVKPPDEILMINAQSPPELIRTYQPGNPETDSGSLDFSIVPAALAAPEIPTAQRAQWRLVGEDDAHWRDSGATCGNLPAGDYLIECKPLGGREVPDPILVKVATGETSHGAAVYPPANGAVPATWHPLDAAMIHTASAATPYGCVGRVGSDQTEGTGFLVKSAVVLTDASLVFDEATLTHVTGLRWTAERHRDLLEPVATPVENVMLLTGYASLRSAEATPGERTPDATKLGVAALRLTVPAAGFTGYLASDGAPHAWLGSAAAKRAVGYPSRLDDPSLRGRMHESAVSQETLTCTSSGVYSAPVFEGGIGARGAPLFARHSDGHDYPIAMLLGGESGTMARAIDSEILRLVFVASDAQFGQEQPVGGPGGTTTGGATLTSWLQGASEDPAVLGVMIGGLPTGTTGRWKIGSTGALRRSGDTVGGISTGTKRIYFPPVAGLLPPGNPDPAVPGGGYLDVDLTGGRKYLLSAPYEQFSVTFSSSVTVRGVALFNLNSDRLGAVVTGWYHDGQLLAGPTSSMLMLYPVTAAMAGTYTAKVSYLGVEYETQPAVLTVLLIPQTVQWTAPLSGAHEALPLDLAATADSGLPVRFEVVSGPATISGSHLTPTAPGTVVVRASQPGDADYAGATPVDRTFELVVSTLASWRFIHFGTSEPTGPAADTADPDGDGQNNLAEYTAGTGPNAPSDVFRILTTQKTATSFTVTANGKAGRSYVLERSAELSGGSWVAVASSGSLQAAGTVTLTDPQPPGGAAFYRVRVNLP